MSKKAVVIGAGFAGLAAATSLADKGFQVQILEKNDQLGGRARSFSVSGYTFDMGPSWYWMPDVFENYFRKFGKSVSDYYELKRLDPSYRVFFDENDVWDLPAELSEIQSLFEKHEKGSGEKLRQFLSESAYKYQVGMQDLVYKPSRSLLEFADKRVVFGLFQLDLLKSMRKYVHSYFKDARIRQLMEFPILFLGGTPQNTPALYSLMNYADMCLGTWYPLGGMHEIVKAMVSLAEEKGVEILPQHPVKELITKDGIIVSAKTETADFEADVFVGAADYHHIEHNLLPEKDRQYSEKYWDSRKMAPSSLLFYLGIEGKIDGLKHHNLFFDEDFDGHAQEIYQNPRWPSKPLFYACCPSKTDQSAAPVGCENLFLLMPVAPNLQDNEETRERYYELIMNRLEKHTGQEIREKVMYKKSYAHRDFVGDYHAYKGNAYGLANVLKQTAILKPSLKSKKISNLYYAGQLTVPGPGVPPSLISGQVAANEIQKDFATFAAS